MTHQLMTSFYLTAAGMGLVFAAILLLWGLMVLVVRLTGDQRAPEAGLEAQARSDVAERERMRRAAVAAIAIALNRELDYQPHEFPIPPTSVVSAWQSVRRANLLNRRGSVR